VFRKSSGNSWTTPPEISLLVIVIRLSYYKIASLARIAGANGVFNLPVFSRAECTKMVCKCSLVERLDLLPMAVLLMIGGKLPARRAKSAHFVGHLPISFYQELLRGMTGKNKIRRYVYILTSATPTLAKPTSSVPGPGTRSWSAPSLTASAALDDPPFICYHFDMCRTIGTVDGRRHPDARTR
jgi:hypothetical protein